MKPSRSKRRADRIRSDIRIVQVLADYGYRVYPDAYDREQQFLCDLHGDGRDSKPSARYYPESNSMYCFACGRARDAVSLVMEKEGVPFHDACSKLERRYGLAPLPWDEADDDRNDQVVLTLTRNETWSDTLKRTDSYLRYLTKNKTLPMDDVLHWWEVFDRVCYGVQHEGWDERKGILELATIRAKIMAELGLEEEHA